MEDNETDYLLDTFIELSGVEVPEITDHASSSKSDKSNTEVVESCSSKNEIISHKLGDKIDETVNVSPKYPFLCNQDKENNLDNKYQSTKITTLTQQLPLSKTNNYNTKQTLGLWIINPLIAHNDLEARMKGREFVPFATLGAFIRSNCTDKNWVFAAVLVDKSRALMSKKGNQYMIWKLSDLQNDLKTLSLFIFSRAYKICSKYMVGDCVAILNASVFQSDDNSGGNICLSINDSQRVLPLGKSKSFGICKSVKKDGNQCTAFVNRSRSEYCIYHVKKEYQKLCNRSDLGSSLRGNGLLDRIRSEVNASRWRHKSNLSEIRPVSQRNRQKHTFKDAALLHSLERNSDDNNSLKVSLTKHPPTKQRIASTIDRSPTEQRRDMALLKKLQDNTQPKTEANVEQNTQSFIPKLQNVGVIDLTKRSNFMLSKAKMNALNYVQKHGTFEPSNPNSTRPKRRSDRSDDLCSKNKQAKVSYDSDVSIVRSERFKKLMAASSANSDLMLTYEQQEQERYFDKLSLKEQMEENMINTFKVKCKAVKCLKCKYISFSASDLCKSERHPLRVFDAVKRFFECSNCKFRTASLEVVPLKACNSCGMKSWKRTGMIKEKIVDRVCENLSIRGGEQKFVNSVATNVSLSLLVPTE